MKKRKMNFLIWLLMILMVGATACSQEPTSSSSSNPPTRTPRPTEAPNPSPEPTNTPPEPAKPSPDPIEETKAEKIYLPVEIVYEFLGGGGAGCGTYYQFGDIYVPELPAIILLNHEGLYQYIGRNTPGLTVCLIGMPENTPLWIFFSHVKQEFLMVGMLETDFEEGSYIGDVFWTDPYNIPSWHAGAATILDDSTSIFEFDIWWSGEIPSGNWLLQVVNGETDKLLSEAQYLITQDDLPRLEATTRGIDLFTLQPNVYFDSNPFCRYLNSFKIGNSVSINGSALPANKQLTLGIYNSELLLMAEETITTDQKGDLLFDIPPGLLSSGNIYYVYAIWDSNFVLTGQGLVESGGTDTCFTLPDNL